MEDQKVIAIKLEDDPFTEAAEPGDSTLLETSNCGIDASYKEWAPNTDLLKALADD